MSTWYAPTQLPSTVKEWNEPRVVERVHGGPEADVTIVTHIRRVRQATILIVAKRAIGRV